MLARKHTDEPAVTTTATIIDIVATITLTTHHPGGEHALLSYRVRHSSLKGPPSVALGLRPDRDAPSKSPIRNSLVPPRKGRTLWESLR